MLKNLFYLSILTSSVIISWILFGIYHNYTTSTISRDQSILITPIQPRFDEDTIKGLATRKAVHADLKQKRSEATPSPSLSPVPIIESTASGAAEI